MAAEFCGQRWHNGADSGSRQLSGRFCRAATARQSADGGTGPAGGDDGSGGTGGGTGGAEVELDIQDGFIVGAKVTKGGSGFTSLPEVRINSDTGIGGRLLPVLKFTKVGDAKKILAQLPKNIEIVTVIDCVQQ